ncbi:4-hydroxybenzoate octaprenyltransferase [Clostridia bacterium]|nr:4-hydroxybenzoate octaprenyltransferase [Clostridia bacterium]
MVSKLKNLGKLVMFSHTIFSLPFGLIAMLWARGGVPPLGTFLYILAALVFARNGANAFNRIADRKIDAENPRTANRPLQSGTVKLRDARIIVIICFAALAFCAWRLNTLCLLLLPLAIFIFVFYSYTKRFTWLCHFILGLACGGAPVGAWAAVTGTLTLTPFLLGGAVCFWVAGFDIIYATQDIDFDRSRKLRSVPARFGKTHALVIAALSHAAAVGCLLILALFRGWWYLLGVAAVSGLLAVEHYMTFTGKKINFIAYNMNQIVSVTFLFFAISDFIFGGIINEKSYLLSVIRNLYSDVSLLLFGQ